MRPENTTEFTPMQLEYIKFLAAGKIDKDGKKWSREDFATKVAKVNPSTLYDWQRIPGFKEALFQETMSRVSDWIPAMTRAQVKKAMQGDTPAFKVVMNQLHLLVAERIETKNENHNIDAALSE